MVGRVFSIGERLDDEALEIAQRAAVRGYFTDRETDRLHYLRTLAQFAIISRWRSNKIETGRRLPGPAVKRLLKRSSKGDWTL